MKTWGENKKIKAKPTLIWLSVMQVPVSGSALLRSLFSSHLNSALLSYRINLMACLCQYYFQTYYKFSRDRRRLSYTALVKGSETGIFWRHWRIDFILLRCHRHIPTVSQFWPCLCRLWRCIHRAVTLMGMVDCSKEPRSVWRGRGKILLCLTRIYFVIR